MTTETPSLRARRRRQTATEIQVATLSLILERGLADVTNEMIATRAGISLRTFFNYYPNKEAAAVGAPPDFSDESLERFANGKGSLLADMKALTEAHVRDLAVTREVLSLLGQVWEKEPSLVSPLHIAGRAVMMKLANAMTRRLGDEKRALAEALSQLYFVALTQAFRRWSTEPGFAREEIPGEVSSTLNEIAGALAG